MTEQRPSKEQVSLDDLKRAISYATTDVDDFDSDASRERACADAWRAAFKWHRGWLQRFNDAESASLQRALEDEELTGIRLIENLR